MTWRYKNPFFVNIFSNIIDFEFLLCYKGVHEQILKGVL